MFFIWKMSYAHLKVTKLRTILTVAGIVIGTISVLAMTSIGTGVSDYITRLQESEGSIHEITVTARQANESTTKEIDSAAIRELKKLSGVSNVYPVTYCSLYLEYLDNDKFGTYATVIGVPAEYLQSMDLALGELPKDSGIRPELLIGGYFPEELKVNSTSGYTFSLADYYFHDDSELIGKGFSARDSFNDSEEAYHLNVSGMTARSFDPNVYTEINTLIRMMKFRADDGIVPTQPLDSNGFPYAEWIYDSAIVQVEDPDQVENITNMIRNIGYSAENHLAIYQTIKKITDTAMLAFGGIGLIALIVAVIGIVNTMSTAIYDRRQEICLLKLLGCDKDDLLLLILTESSLMGLTGGVVGLLLTLLGIYLIINPAAHMLLKLNDLQLARMPLSAAVLTILGAVLISVIAGIYPAHMARKMSATELLN